MSRRNKSDTLAIDGILLLNKPVGISSNQALQRVRHALNARKGGHTGSLDPFATGMLPLCFGQATRFSQFLLNADKEYRATARLGEASSTGDTEGEIIKRLPVPPLSEDLLNQALARFLGTIEQMPPMYSALKHQGRRLYQLAREGIEVERPLRSVQIHELKLTGLGPDWFSMSVRCSKGTYIRTLVEDLARALDTVGHTTQLHRVGVTPFDGHKMVSLDDSPEQISAALLPVDAGLLTLPELHLSASRSRLICCGRSLPATEESPGMRRLYDDAGQFLGVAEVTEQAQLKAVRLLATAPPQP